MDKNELLPAPAATSAIEAEDRHDGFLPPADGAVRLSNSEIHTLHRWFWLRLASGPGAIRDWNTVDPHVRSAVVAHGLMDEVQVAALTWDALFNELGARAAAEARVAKRIVSRLRRRLASVAAPVELDATACDILILGTAMQRERALQQLGAVFTLDEPDDVIARVAEAIDASEEAVAEALHPAAPLKFWGLLKSPYLITGIAKAIEPQRAIRHHLYGVRPLDESLIHRFCMPLDVTPDPSVDLAHLADAAHVVQAFLRTRASARVLLHGRPGIGTSEFIKEVVRRLGWQAYIADLRNVSEGQLLNDKELGADAAYAALRGRPGSIVVLDHATRILRSSERDFRAHLDLCAVPTVWVAESLDLIDEDIVSRFDHILELEAPPRATRIAMLRRMLGPLGVSDGMVELVAGAETFTPADAVRLERSVPVLAEQGIAPDAALEVLGVRRARKVAMPIPEPVRRPGLPYRMEWIRANADLSRLATGLARTGAGTLLFSGPPGTGKTEFARHLAAKLGWPLLIRGAADINQPYIGQTEKAMAQAFEEARRDRSVLLIDEVDSFLRSRESAVRSWEIAQVNEMLTQLDRFEGIAIFTTNALASLDPAVMRRIDRKIEFDYIAAEHRCEVFTAAAAVLGLPALEIAGPSVDRIRKLSGLALGDVAVVLRGERLEPTITNSEGLYRALAIETDRRLGRRNPVGFVDVL